MNKIKLAFSCIFYPVAMGRYLLDAFLRRKDVEVWSVGPYTGNWIPWTTDPYNPNGMRIQSVHPISSPSYALPTSLIQQKVPYAFIKPQMPWKPDVFVQFDAGWNFLDRPEGISVRVQSDPHVLKGWYELTKHNFDYDFSMQEIYRTEGEYLLPYGYDPYLHFPMDIPKEYDACLIGLHYQQRDALINRLRNRNVTCHYSLGEVFDEYRIAYNKAKIALSWSSHKDIPSRFWEGLAMRLPVVTNRLPDLIKLGFVEGEHYIGFDSLEEAEKQVLLLLSDDERREKIAQQGYEAVRPHTWDARAEQLLKTIGIL